MRVLILIALLCNMAFSALYLNGATYTQVVTINHTSVAETNGHFLFQKKIPRTGNVILSVDSANNVGITRINDTTRIPRWVVFTTDTIFLYADIAVSSTVDTSYRLQFGKALNETNSSAAFTNCGIVQAWLFDEDDGAATVRNYANGSVGTVNSPAYISNRKAIFTGAATGPSTNSIITTENELMLPNRTIITVGKSSTIAGTHSYINNRNYSVGGGFVLYTNATNVVAALSPAASVQTPQNAGSRMQIAASISSDNVLKLYTDGVYRAMGNVPTGIYATPSNVIIGGNNTGGTGYIGFNGEIEQIVVYDSELSLENITTNYNMLFNSSAFATLGTPALNELTGSRWSAYKSAFKSAYRKAFK